MAEAFEGVFNKVNNILTPSNLRDLAIEIIKGSISTPLKMNVLRKYLTEAKIGLSYFIESKIALSEYLNKGNFALVDFIEGKISFNEYFVNVE